MVSKIFLKKQKSQIVMMRLWKNETRKWRNKMTYEELKEASIQEARRMLKAFDEKEVEEFLQSDEVEETLQEHYRCRGEKCSPIGDCLALMF